VRRYNDLSEEEKKKAVHRAFSNGLAFYVLGMCPEDQRFIDTSKEIRYDSAGQVRPAWRIRELLQDDNYISACMKAIAQRQAEKAWYPTPGEDLIIDLRSREEINRIISNFWKGEVPCESGA
jgi:hypothetical protein